MRKQTQAFSMLGHPTRKPPKGGKNIRDRRSIADYFSPLHAKMFLSVALDAPVDVVPVNPSPAVLRSGVSF